MYHTRQKKKFEEQLLRKDFLVCPRNKADLDHTLFLLAYHKTLTKSLLAVRPEKVKRREKKLERHLQSFLKNSRENTGA